MFLEEAITYSTINYITNDKTVNIKSISNLTKIGLLTKVIIYKRTTNNDTEILTTIINIYQELYSDKGFNNLLVD